MTLQHVCVRAPGRWGRCDGMRWQCLGRVDGVVTVGMYRVGSQARWCRVIGFRFSAGRQALLRERELEFEPKLGRDCSELWP